MLQIKIKPDKSNTFRENIKDSLVLADKMGCEVKFKWGIFKPVYIYPQNIDQKSEVLEISREQAIEREADTIEKKYYQLWKFSDSIGPR